MANLCFTQFAIFGDKNSLEEFKKNIESQKKSDGRINFNDVLALYHGSPDLIKFRSFITDIYPHEDGSTLLINFEDDWDNEEDALRFIISTYNGKLRYEMESVVDGGPYINTDVIGKYFPGKIYMDISYNGNGCEIYAKDEEDALKQANRELDTSFSSFDEMVETIEKAIEEDDDDAMLVLEPFVDADGNPLWKRHYSGAHTGALYQIYNGSNMIDIVDDATVYCHGETAIEVKSRPLVSVMRDEEDIDIIENDTNKAYGYSTIYIVDNMIKSNLYQDRINIYQDEPMEKIIEDLTIGNMQCGEFPLSEIDKAFKFHNTFWLKKDEEIDMYSPVYYLKYSELKLLLRSGFNSERIYCVLTK